MAQYIDKSAVVAEIERRISNHNKELKHASDEDFVSSWASDEENQKLALTALIPFINTLEVKEVDLEEKATQLSQKYFPDEENIWARSNIEVHKCKSACIEMVEWLKAQKGE